MAGWRSPWCLLCLLCMLHGCPPHGKSPLRHQRGRGTHLLQGEREQHSPNTCAAMRFLMLLVYDALPYGPVVGSQPVARRAMRSMRTTGHDMSLAPCAVSRGKPRSASQGLEDQGPKKCIPRAVRDSVAHQGSPVALCRPPMRSIAPRVVGQSLTAWSVSSSPFFIIELIGAIPSDMLSHRTAAASALSWSS